MANVVMFCLLIYQAGNFETTSVACVICKLQMARLLLSACFSRCLRLMWRHYWQWTGILMLLWALRQSLLSWKSSIASSSASLRLALHT